MKQSADYTSRTTCYVFLAKQAAEKMQMPSNSTVDDLLKRVIHGNAEQQLSLEAWMQLGKKFFDTERA